MMTQKQNHFHVLPLVKSALKQFYQMYGAIPEALLLGPHDLKGFEEETGELYSAAQLMASGPLSYGGVPVVGKQSPGVECVLTFNQAMTIARKRLYEED